MLSKTTFKFLLNWVTIATVTMETTMSSYISHLLIFDDHFQISAQVFLHHGMGLGDHLDDVGTAEHKVSLDIRPICRLVLQ